MNLTSLFNAHVAERLQTAKTLGDVGYFENDVCHVSFRSFRGDAVLRQKRPQTLSDATAA
jgi:hypothetical protein